MSSLLMLSGGMLATAHNDKHVFLFTLLTGTGNASDM